MLASLIKTLKNIYNKAKTKTCRLPGNGPLIKHEAIDFFQLMWYIVWKDTPLSCMLWILGAQNLF